MDSFVRGRVYGFIEGHPGTHYTEIMHNIGVVNGTLSHDLHMLEKMDMVKSRREGVRYRAFYVTGLKFPKSEGYRLTEVKAEIIRIIRKNNGISQKDLVTRIGKNKTTINYNFKTMERNGIIRLIKKGRVAHCYINDEIQLNR